MKSEQKLKEDRVNGEKDRLILNSSRREKLKRTNLKFLSGIHTK